jgi:hypothetical protein
MSARMTGVVTIVAEGRFQLTDDAGVSHLFLLDRNAGAETAQLVPLQHRQARICVHYHDAANLIGNVATALYLAD